MKFSMLVGAVVLLFGQVALAFMTPSTFPGSSLNVHASASSSARSTAPQMRTRNCDLLGKKANRKARVVTFSHTRIHKVQQVNLQKRKLFWLEGNRWVRLRLSTKGIKTIDKYGLDRAARKFGLDLAKFTA
ncbi:unnamed protein product [Discosporangium mesarthrocarpum]